jgi:hypothetical protein
MRGLRRASRALRSDFTCFVHSARLVHGNWLGVALASGDVLIGGSLASLPSRGAADLGAFALPASWIRVEGGSSRSMVHAASASPARLSHNGTRLRLRRDAIRSVS